MLSVDNFYKVVNIQILNQRRSSFYKYRIYLNKNIYCPTLFIYISVYRRFFSLYYDIIPKGIELYFPLEVAVGDYLCIVENLPSEEDVWNLLSEVNDPELIKILTKMLLHEI